MNTSRPTLVTRRTVARGAAWAVPAIAVGAAAPHAAASAPPPPTVTFTGQGCKLPGQSTDYPWGYRLTFDVVASGPDVITFDPDTVTAPGGQGILIAPTTGIALLTGSNHVTVTIGCTNSANGTATIVWTSLGGAGVATATIEGFNPCKK